MAGIQGIIARVMKLRLVRSFQHYAAVRGPILSSGLAYSALFSVFAGVAVLFSIAGLVLQGNDALRELLIESVGRAIPGLIGSEGAAIDPDELLGSTATLNIAGLIALVGLLVTALGFLASARDAIRSMFGLPLAVGNFAVMKFKDLGFLLGFALTLVVSAALSIAGTAATDFVLGLVGIDSRSPVALIAGRVVTFALVIAINAGVVAALLRLLAGVRIPRFQLLQGALLGGLGTAVLTVLFQLGILGGASNNALLASFVVILGLLVFFNFMCQVLLISAAFTATTLDDLGITVTAPNPPKRIRARARQKVTGPRLRKEA